MLVVIQVKMKSSLHHQMQRTMKKKTKTPVMKTTMNTHTSVATSQFFGKKTIVAIEAAKVDPDYQVQQYEGIISLINNETTATLETLNQLHQSYLSSSLCLERKEYARSYLDLDQATASLGSSPTP